MATTPYLNLYKPAGQDYVMRVRDLNENYDKIDSAYGSSIRTGEIGIVVDGDTAALNISAGDFVIVKNTTIDNIDNGLYIAVNNVTAGVSLTSADLDNTNTGNGGLNALKAEVEYDSGVQTDYNGTSYIKYNKKGNVVNLFAYLPGSRATIPSYGSFKIATLPEGFRPAFDLWVQATSDRSNSDSGGLILAVEADGDVVFLGRQTGMPTSSDFARASISFSV